MWFISGTYSEPLVVSARSTVSGRGRGPVGGKCQDQIVLSAMGPEGEGMVCMSCIYSPWSLNSWAMLFAFHLGLSLLVLEEFFSAFFSPFILRASRSR